MARLNKKAAGWGGDFPGVPATRSAPEVPVRSRSPIVHHLVSRVCHPGFSAYEGEGLAARERFASYPKREYQAAWRSVVLWDKHTWGAHNSVSDPDFPFVRELWRIKRQFALDADEKSQALGGVPGFLCPRLHGFGRTLRTDDAS
jgi:hypothetical protein